MQKNVRWQRDDRPGPNYRGDLAKHLVKENPVTEA